MNWQEEKGKLVKEYDFKSQTELAQFLLKVAQLADKANHHPDVTVTKASHLRLELFTHSENKLTDKDYALVAEIDQIG